MNTAQQVSNINAESGLRAAMDFATAQGFHTQARWFAGHEKVFADGSVLTLRAGKIESPKPSELVWSQATRVAFDV